MRNSARSLFVFGIYLILLGISMIAIPNTILIAFGLPATSEVWIRVAGVLVLVIAFYDVMAGRDNLTSFLRWSVMARSFVIVFIAAFVLLGFVKPILILFGAIELGGAIWTYLALRGEK